MIRIAVFAYGAGSYVLFLAVFLYLIGFMGNFVVPKSIDIGAGEAGTTAWIVDSVLLGLFAVQHSVMARPAFKRRWARIVPTVIERSTYVLFSVAALGLLFWQWQPITAPVWTVSSSVGATVIHVGFFVGWTIVLLGTFMTNHFELFGLRQVWICARGRAHTPIPFTTRGFYRHVRHPLMTGFLLAFWAAPEMTAGHLLFAAVMTAYVLIAIRFEERDLVETLDERYETYRASTPALLPRVASFRTRKTRNGCPWPP